ncbi:LPS export ABC transporter periplasmic protein LptC [Mucilaginibacter sp. RB4R14]|uniref:LPS export ABC transporter periplasmic protein LptC n=1 Tax=Mucilaginibacter aurantiaciroseus TaxID=2949308 RepID=UPI00209001F3|nr:LPS export ABC transporter periplasmic protein LptC [Mucilaginibacter aurantiaciroseus]MCO5937279.1 LPS export ABC transporter periplasmic protein LptC [Mucilaginibacter aurantiaciroseus]
MQSRLKQLSIYLPAVFIALLLSACENDLNKVKAIAAADATKPIQRTTGVDMILSDSGFVKAQLTAPLLIQYDTKKDPYSVMPKGVKVVLYNRALKEDINIIADTGYYYKEKDLIIFHKNVVATRNDGIVYRSEELIWDKNKKQTYSNKNVLMTKPNGEQMTGTSFVSDDKFLNPKFQNSTAIIHVDGGLAQ